MQPKKTGAQQFFELGLLLFSFGVVYFALCKIFHGMALAEQTNGPVLFDAFHAMLPSPQDWSSYIFTMTYVGTVIITIESLRRGFIRASVVLLGYALIIYLRSWTINLWPLSPPTDMILLLDPFVNHFNEGHFVATKDLFFSGHCSALFFFLLATKNKWTRGILLIFNVLVILAISLQRVHYTIDIIGGILVAILVYQICKYLEAFLHKWSYSVFSKPERKKRFLLLFPIKNKK